jgi:hypothetical protein
MIRFKRGDVVKTIRGIAVIVDVLKSEVTGNTCIYARFVGNIGNSRRYDMIELTPELTLGVEEWELATMDELQTAINKRRQSLENELQEALEVAKERHPVVAA